MPIKRVLIMMGAYMPCVCVCAAAVARDAPAAARRPDPTPPIHPRLPCLSLVSHAHSHLLLSHTQPAMEAEALPVIDGLGLTRDAPPLLPPPAPAVSFSGRVGCVDVHVVCNGK